MSAGPTPGASAGRAWCCGLPPGRYLHIRARRRWRWLSPACRRRGLTRAGCFLWGQQGGTESGNTHRRKLRNVQTWWNSQLERQRPCPGGVGALVVGSRGHPGPKGLVPPILDGSRRVDKGRTALLRKPALVRSGGCPALLRSLWARFRVPVHREDVHGAAAEGRSSWATRRGRHSVAP